MSDPPEELALPTVSLEPVDHNVDWLSLLERVSACPVELLVPTEVSAWVPMLCEVPDEEPVIADTESLPPTPPSTLAEAIPGIPPLTEAPAFQLSLCELALELLCPWLIELPVELPNELVVEPPTEALSL